MRVTQRDLQLLFWLNGFGFATIEQISRKLGTGYETARTRIRKMMAANYIRSEYIFHKAPRIHYLTAKACALTGDNLRAMERVRMQTYEHDHQVINLSLDLQQRMPGCVFIPERRLRRGRESYGFTERGHIPDGELFLPATSDPIAVELELTLKSRRRLEEVITRYTRTLKFSEVWYFAAPDLIPVLEKFINADPLFKIINYEKWENDRTNCFCG